MKRLVRQSFSDWTMQQIARCTYCEGRLDMKMVWVLVRGKNPVWFWQGPYDNWTVDEAKAGMFPTAAAARERAYNLQGEYQDTIVAEGVYRMANAPAVARRSRSLQPDVGGKVGT